MLELFPYVLGAADGMSGLISTGESILKWAQRLALIGAAISFCIGGYYLMFGGERGRHKSITWFVGGAVGLVVVMGAYGLAQGVDSNVKFGG
ncbi:hypothetical protein AC623_20685 [Bacillus sp. FJAT-27231]|uniref:hypothetical protein n=1 Tax=Bacillus sp. FJAT-27231 TaxID=1679168 RepID=UPI000670C168|nr:hypothetical protein [Bacillus sp. FJAT-27231]KMY52555.1 hypothetical protein AC623_20685 [Bacillus sp. FJAT-27231]